MKVIFLDIDGVLNCAKTPNPRKLPYIADPRLLRRFARLVERSKAKVVLSSTWRYDPAGLFSARHWGIHFIDVIPDMPGKPRRDEILAWLRHHPRVKRFVVIDDEYGRLFGSGRRVSWTLRWPRGAISSVTAEHWPSARRCCRTPRTTVRTNGEAP